MFKDLYNSATRKIPTEDAYLRVMEKVSAKKTNKYAYLKVAALAACFVLTFSMFSLYEKFEGQTIDPTESAVISHEDETFVSEQIEIPANTETKPTVTQPAKKVADETPRVIPKSTTKEAVSQNVPITNIVKNQGIPEGMISASARLYAGGEVYTQAEYEEYLGKNVADTVTLPENFINETSGEQVITLDEGDGFNDEWTYYFTSDESSVYITTTKKPDKIMGVLENDEYQKSTISDHSAVIFEEDTQKTAYLMDDDIGYTVTAFSVTDEDFSNVLTSLIN